MSNVQLEYVVSAMGMAGPTNTHLINSQHFNPGIVDKLTSVVDTLKTSVKGSCVNTDPTVAMLFNAYTEKKFTTHLDDYKKFHMDKIYADSGGLQMVTAGKEITEEIKDKIYDVQTYSDYAMCFDIIPLESVSLTRTRNERSNVGNKIFDQSRHVESGRMTGINIKRQIEYFRSKGATTKVIIIVQGNTPEDMVEFYRQIQDQLSDKDFENVGGIAVADTCMGNKELETIDMLIAARKIAQFAHPNAVKQLHLLGVGSIPRMAPVIYLRESGFLDAFEKISYDSSSHTVCFNYGLMKLNGTCKSLGTFRNHLLESHLFDIYTTFQSSFEDIGTFDWYMDEVFFAEDGSWIYSKTAERAGASGDRNKILAASLVNFTYSMYQVKNFIECLDRVAGGEFIGARNDKNIKAITMLQNVSDDKDMQTWLSVQKPYVSSARIARKEDSFGLDKFFV